MKKILSWVLVFTIVCGIALAESRLIDLTKLDTSELMELLTSVTDELVSRGNGNASIIHSGRYRVGTDILPGQYDLLIVYKNPTTSGRIWRRDAKTDKILDDVYVYVGSTIHVNLEDGIVLHIVDCDAIITQSEKQSWMP